MDNVEIFKDDASQWRWHRQSENGKVVADGSEGYVNLADCLDMAKEVNGEEVTYDVST